MNLALERRAWTLIYLALGLVEGGTAAVLVRALFSQVVPTLAVDLIVALVTSAPSWANLASLFYARRAQGRPKIAFMQPLLFAMVACIAALACVPRTGPGLLMFFVVYVAARLLWTGVETVRAVLWSVNYPSRIRARITGRIAMNTSIALALVGVLMGWLLGLQGPAWRIFVLVCCMCAVAGAIRFGRFQVRSEQALLDQERERLAEGIAFGVRGMRELLRRDPAFREYQYALAMFGAGLLAVTPLLIVCLNEVLQLPALTQVVVITAIPVLAVPLSVQAWASYLDRHRVLSFRAAHSRFAVGAVVLFMMAVTLRWHWLLFPGAALLGLSNTAGSLGWTLGHNQFAPRGEETRYMALHVTMTGLRGLLMPPLAVGVYHGLSALRPGWGPVALVLPLLLVAGGAARFAAMDRNDRGRRHG